MYPHYNLLQLSKIKIFLQLDQLSNRFYKAVLDKTFNNPSPTTYRKRIPI